MRRKITNALVALSAALASAPALAQTAVGQPEYWHYSWSWGHMIFGSLMMILFWGGIIVAIFLAVRWGGGGRPSRNNAFDILHERFARGEIDQGDFEERKRLLSR